MGVVRWVAGHVQGFYARAGILLSAGLFLSLIGLWGLSHLTEEVLEGDTARLDRAVLVWLNGHATPGLDRAAVEVTALGDTLVLVMLAAVAIALLALLGHRLHAWLLAAAVGGAGVITPVLKAVFDRPRPTVFEWRAHYPETSAAYPSGHATMSMVTLVTIAFIIHRLSSRTSVAVAASAIAAVVILLIGLSRLYLGLHFPSDVLAGFVIGFAWAVFCALTLEAVARPGDERSVRESPEPLPGMDHVR